MFFRNSQRVNVLNLIINGIPSIPNNNVTSNCSLEVLNLIINGIPSILMKSLGVVGGISQVLNLIINGIPSILGGMLC